MAKLESVESLLTQTLSVLFSLHGNQLAFMMWLKQKGLINQLATITIQQKFGIKT